MEFLIELGIVTAAIVAVVVSLSVAILYPSKAYMGKAAPIITPIILSIIVGAAGPEDYTSLQQWAYFVLPSLILAPIWTSSLCHRKRLKGLTE